MEVTRISWNVARGSFVSRGDLGEAELLARDTGTESDNSTGGVPHCPSESAACGLKKLAPFNLVQRPLQGLSLST